MRVALVYDLRDDYRALGFSEEEIAEFDNVGTIDELAGALEALGCEVERVGRGQALAARFVSGERFDLVFSIAEGVKGRSREAQVAALCELFDQPYLFSDPLTMAVSLDKAVAKRLVRDAGVPTPAFAVAETSASELAGWEHFPAFVKPLAEGTGKGCEAASLVHDAGELAAAATRVIERYRQPALVEHYLSGREFTVGIVGNGQEARVLGVCEILLKEQAEANVYSLHNKELCEDLVIYAPADDGEARLAGTRALEAYWALECRDAARIDFRSDAKGEPYFLEANPLAGLNPWHSDLPILAAQNGVEFVALIGMILDAGLAATGVSGLLRSAGESARDGSGGGRLHPGPACGDDEPPRRDRYADCRRGRFRRAFAAWLRHHDRRAWPRPRRARRSHRHPPAARLQPGRCRGRRREARTLRPGTARRTRSSLYGGRNQPLAGNALKGRN